MTQVSTDFETGVNAATISTGDAGSPTALDAVNIPATAAVVYDNTHKYGNLAAKLTTGGTAGQVYLGWSTGLGTVTDHYGRLYFWMTGLPPTTLSLVHFLNSATLALRIRVKSDGKVEFLDKDGAAQATSTTTLSTGQWYRIEWHIVHGAGTGAFDVKIFTSPDSASPAETISGTSKQLLSQANEVRFGQNFSQSSMGGLWLDHPVMGATSYPGPVSVGNSYTGTRQNAVLELCDAGISGSYASSGRGVPVVLGRRRSLASGILELGRR